MAWTAEVLTRPHATAAAADRPSDVLRPVAVALCFASGVAAAALGPLCGAPLVWLAALVVSLVGCRGVARVPLALVLAGGLIAAMAERHDRIALDALVGRDDRIDDRVEGDVVGALDEGDDGWRFLLDADEATIEVAVLGTPHERCGDRPCGVPDVLPGDRLRIDGRLFSPRGFRVPGSPDERRALAARGAVAVLVTDWIRVERIAVGGPGPLRLCAWLRRTLATRLGDGEREIADDRSGPLLRALVLGVRSDVPTEVSDAWRDAGMSHLLAVSGMHLAAVALFGYFILARLIAALPRGPVDPRRWAAVAAAPLAIGYTLVTGAPASALRALIAVLVYLLGVACGRRAMAIDALSVAAVVILATRPQALFDASFQLSIAAAAALALGGRPRAMTPLQPIADRPLRRLVRRVESAGWAGLRASLVALLATCPLTALHFGVVQPGGAVANLIASPLTELVALPLGLLAAIIGPLASPLLWIARLAIAIADRIGIAIAATIPTVWSGAPTPIELGLAAAIVLGLLATLRTGSRRGVRIAGFATLALGIAWSVEAHIVPRLGTATRVTFVDVGQGDAALIELPGKRGTWLVDGGGRPFVAGDASPMRRRRAEERPGQAVVSLMAERRLRRIELVVLSHPHPDHYLGLRAIARRVAIDTVWLAAPPADRPLPPDLRQLLAELSAGGTRIESPPLGRAMRQAGVELDVVGPRSIDGSSRAGDRTAVDPVLSVNDGSLVVRLGFAGRRVLFLGDVEVEGEELIAAEVGTDLAADVVKVAHHGSPTSSSAALIARVGATLAVISCGVANRFGFPAPAVVARWQAGGAEVVRTDQRGAVSVILERDGALNVETMDPP